MIWYLLFCAAGYKGGVMCSVPLRMPDQETCRFIGAKMGQTANEVERAASYRCIQIKKPLS